MVERVDGRGAVFLDRDGTIVHDPGFLHDPAAVRLLAGAGGAVRRLNDAGWLVVTISNQSG
jgi:D-glycero-D-manno-heptose 1,7-bisphosphate phosphatase